MMWDRDLTATVGETLCTEKVRSFLFSLFAAAKIPTVVADGSGRLLYALPPDGYPAGSASTCRASGTGAGTRCPYWGSSCSPEESVITQEVRFQEQRVAEIRGCLAGVPDRGLARQSLKLAADWLQQRIQAEYDVDSLSSEILNKYEELNLLYELSEEMGAVFNTREICEIVLRKALNVIGAEKASILLVDPKLNALRVIASAGIPEDVAKGLVLGTDTGICGHVIRTGKPLLIEDLADFPGVLSPGPGEYRTESFLSVPLLLSPLKIKEKVIGVINLADKPSQGTYHAGDLKLLSAISSQAALSIYNSMLIRDLKENERIQKEMEIAGEVQRNLLPRHAPCLPGTELAGRCVSAMRVGGDYYDFFPAPEGGVGIVVADVSGHSIGAGIMMSITRGLLQSEAVRGRSPGQLLKDVNRLLFEDLSSSELFITMAFFSYDPTERRLLYANGGHNPALLLKQEEEEPLLLDGEGMAIGFLADVDFEEKSYDLSAGDLLVAYTDGLTEAESPEGEPFGMRRFIRYLRRLRERPATDILDGLYQAVWEHLGGQNPQHAQQDDITLVVLKVGEPDGTSAPAAG
ncbi:MAG: GAF domain-containing SpoIIE family protein phosphatase [bacterium]